MASYDIESKSMVEATLKIGILLEFLGRNYIHLGTLEPFSEIIIEVSVKEWFNISFPVV